MALIVTIRINIFSLPPKRDWLDEDASYSVVTAEHGKNSTNELAGCLVFLNRRLKVALTDGVSL